MKLITSQQIQGWSKIKQREIAGKLPHLLKNLIVTSYSNSEYKDLEISSEESIAYGDLDGSIEILSQKNYLPQGKIIFEIGTQKKSITSKAKSDITKRASNLGLTDRKNINFVFVTTSLFPNKSEWEKSEKVKGEWNSVKVINSELLEHWLEELPSVAVNFAYEIGYLSSINLFSINSYWNEKLTTPQTKLDTSFIIGSRKEKAEKLIHLLVNYTKVSVSCNNRIEGIYFILAAILERKIPVSNCIIIENENDFRIIAKTKSNMILIPLFIDRGLFDVATKNNNKVIYSSDSLFSQNDIYVEIENSYSKEFKEGLIKSGYNDEKAVFLTRECLCDISTFLRIEKFTMYSPSWYNTENLKILLRMALLGSWDEDKQEDKFIVELFLDLKYSEITERINYFQNFIDSPIKRNRSVLRIKAREEILNLAIDTFNYDNIADYLDVFNYLFNLENPILNLPEQRRIFAGLDNIVPQYSKQIKNGILYGMLLCQIKLKNQAAKQKIDENIKNILINTQTNVWQENNQYMPEMAEISPKIFAETIYEMLETNDIKIINLFSENDNFLGPSSPHTNLLFALEKIAWYPHIYSIAVKCLVKLSKIDPGGRLANRPINSLTSLLSSWNSQSMMPTNQILKPIYALIETNPEEVKKALFSIIDLDKTFICTHKPNFLGFNFIEVTRTWKDIEDILTEALDLIHKLKSSLSEEDCLYLLNEGVKLFPKIEEKLFTMASGRLLDGIATRYSWENLSSLIMHHEDFEESDWALPKDRLLKYKNLLAELETQNLIEKYFHLFTDRPIITHKKAELYHEELFNLRKNALQSIINENGYNQLLTQAINFENQYIYGNVLADIIDDKDDGQLEEFIRFNDENKSLGGIHGFCYRLQYKHGSEYMINLFQKFFKTLKNKFSILTHLNIDEGIINFIETQNDETKTEFYQNITATLWHLNTELLDYVCFKLLQINREFDLIHIISMCNCNVSTKVMMESLMQLYQTDSKQTERDIKFDIEKIFKELYKRDDADKNQLLSLEIIYFKLLCGYGENNLPKIIYESFCTNSEFITEFLMEYTNCTDWKQAFKMSNIFSAWTKLTYFENKEDIKMPEFLNYFESTKKLLKQHGLNEKFEFKIGEILGFTYSRRNPQLFIYEIIEKDNEQVRKGFKHSLYHGKSGAHFRAIDYGAGEVVKADEFSKIAKSILTEFPQTSYLFTEVSDLFLEKSKREKERDEGYEF